MMIPWQAKASDNVQYLTIITPTQTIKIALSEKPVITFTHDQLVITTEEKQVEVPVAEISSYNFESDEATAIKDLDVSARHKQGLVAFDRLKAGAPVMLFNAKGERLRTTNAKTDGTAVIDMHGLAKGIYIVRSDNLSVKIINK